MNTNFIKTDSNHVDYILLVKLLDADLAISDGEDHSFYNQYNKSDQIKHVVLAYIDDVAIGCGALKEFSSQVMEIKRMYVKPTFRGKGVATQILINLEHWAKALSYQKCILETGKKQPEAIGLYHKNRYTVIDNYGPYVGVSNSVCFEKVL